MQEPHIIFYNEALQQYGIQQLTAEQSRKFIIACRRVIFDNPHLGRFALTDAAIIYLRNILNFPGLEIPDVPNQ